jgi:hypothetical protein
VERIFITQVRAMNRAERLAMVDRNRINLSLWR